MPQPVKWKGDIWAGTDLDGWPAADPSLAAGPGGGLSIFHFQDFHSDAGPTNVETIEGTLFSAAGVRQKSTGFGGGTNSLVGQPAHIYLPDGRFLTSWMQASGDASGVNVYAQLRFGDNVNDGPRFLVAGGAGVQAGPAVAATAAGFAISVLDGSVSGGQLLTSFYDLAGTVTGQVVGPSARDVEIVALANGTYAVLWQSAASSIEFRIHAANGVALTAVIDADGGAGTFDYPDITELVGGRIAITYRDQVTGLIQGRTFDVDGSHGSTVFTADTGIGCKAAALHDGRLMLIYERAGDIFGQVLFADGTADGGAFMIPAAATPIQAQPVIATLADGRVAVSWITSFGYNPDSNSTGGTPMLAIFDPRESGLAADATGLADDWHGTPFDDTVYLGSGDDRMDGAAGADRLFGENGRDALLGSVGNDILDGGPGDDALDGGAGIDTASYASVAAGVSVDLSVLTAQDTVGGGIDVLIGTENVAGSRFADSLTGDGTANVLAGGAGNDTLDGAGGSDTADYSAASGSGVTVNLAILVAQAISVSEGSDTLIGIENLIGTALADRLTGDAGNNTLAGGSGDDTISGTGGDDTLDGAGGNDAADYSTASGSGVTVNLAILVAQTISVSEGSDTLINIENLTGSAFADSLTGDGGANVFSGGGQNDVYHGVEAGDTVIELLNQGNDTVNTALALYKLPANVERVNFTGIGNFVGIGHAGDNRFAGGAGNDRFVDVLGGADIFSGGSGRDSIDFRTSATGTILNFGTNIHGGAAAGDTYVGIEKYLGSLSAADTMTAGAAGRAIFAGYGGDDALTGGGERDQLLGGAGNDTLMGGADRDALDGGIGNDTLTGGTQGDVFVFTGAAFGQDVITDYQDGLDKFKVFTAVADDVSDFTITGNGSNSVVLSLIAAPLNTITLNGLAPITITNADFVFY